MPAFATRSVYFGFDQYTVQPDYQPLLTQHAHYLKNHPQRQVFIQGNTDERSSSEYNLALGQKRSEAVPQNLALLGMPLSRMEAVSVGKEELVAKGHDEEL
ncbi:OmpA family protein [Burkholderia sp. OK233]|nr:OmpA family protein [Burkholderia sp. OK233]